MKKIRLIFSLWMIMILMMTNLGWSYAEEEKEGTNVVVIDGVTYKNYKGPVQGEIKYKEGRPASQNSKIRKASGDIESPYHVDLVVTTDFGHKKVYAKNVGLVKDEVGMEVLFRNLDIQTAYGGGFVNSINGIESKFTFYTGKNRKKQDWFYWVNGILAPVGVAEYRPHSGDVVWWDYHDWGTTMFAPAVIGSYPQPFKSGSFGKNPGTVIMYTDDYKDEAKKLKESLIKQGVKQIDLSAYNPKVLEKPKKYYILLGPWDQLAKNSKLIKDINRKNKLIGTYVKFEGEKVKALDFKGKTRSSYGHAGAIYAYAPGIGSVRPIWMVTGTDDEGVKKSLDVLLNQPKAIDKHFSVVVSKNGIENVPYSH
ncbi:MAG: DUF4430 domain-containing protein [Marinisporobacter sp.]|jgi:hypothetical protein|nr:DUF4430 domain-containing protein [Marinisporobacter sp.]